VGEWDTWVVVSVVLRIPIRIIRPNTQKLHHQTNPSIAEVRKEWSSTSATPYVFMAWCSVSTTDFALTLYQHRRKVVSQFGKKGQPLSILPLQAVSSIRHVNTYQILLLKQIRSDEAQSRCVNFRNKARLWVLTTSINTAGCPQMLHHVVRWILTDVSEESVSSSQKPVRIYQATSSNITDESYNWLQTPMRHLRDIQPPSGRRKKNQLIPRVEQAFQEAQLCSR
jgi:hypothetical protein